MHHFHEASFERKLITLLPEVRQRLLIVFCFRSALLQLPGLCLTICIHEDLFSAQSLERAPCLHTYGCGASSAFRALRATEKRHQPMAACTSVNVTRTANSAG